MFSSFSPFANGYFCLFLRKPVEKRTNFRLHDDKLLMNQGKLSYSYNFTSLHNYLLFQVISKSFVTFKIAVTSYCNRTVTFKIG
jgi:hypothetical protein